MKSLTINQNGVGLVEVLVALLLLAVAVLGFSTTQLHAMKATDESIMRSDAMNAMRSLSEDVRINPSEKIAYFNYISGVWNSNSAKTVEGYCTNVELFKSSKVTNCMSNVSCSPKKQSAFNSYESMQAVCKANMMMNAISCPGTETKLRKFSSTAATKRLLPKLCLIASWNKTLPEVGSEKTSCINNKGTYISGSSCVVLEVY